MKNFYYPSKPKDEGNTPMNNIFSPEFLKDKILNTDEMNDCMDFYSIKFPGFSNNNGNINCIKMGTCLILQKTWRK